MALTSGTRLGPYEIVAAIGAGGMGEVYRATDTSLGRQVAIKVLPDAFAKDVERLARFEREAKTLASLNHPHIAQIYGLEKSSGVQALVMELVEGEDLSQRIARGAIPLDEALAIAKQVCEALEAAHEQGIVHRDLKPANIKVTPDGVVKVLDFGLAKLTDHDDGWQPAAGGAHLSLSPTITSPAMMTGVGVLLGTAAYMAPEQAKGKPADKRSDIWAFGCVLYEMLTGQRAFTGDDVSDVLASVLAREPDWTRLPAAISPACGTYLRCCLQRDPRQRVQAIGDVRLALAGAFETAVPLAATPAPWLTRGTGLVSIVAAAAGIAAAVLAVPAVRYMRQTPAAPLPEMRLEITTPPTANPASLAISPDGLRIVFAAKSEGRSQLWIRSLGSVTARALPETEAAVYPFWSPDSRSVGFLADGKLKRIDINGSSAQILANAESGTGGAWNRDGVIVFARSLSGPIFRVSATGGEPTAVTRLDAGQAAHIFPQFLPDGQHFLFYVRGTPQTRGVYIGQLDGTQTRRVLDADSAAAYAPPGQLLFARGGTLFAQAFDPDRGVLSGDPFPVAEQIAIDFNGAAVSASRAGPIVFRSGSGGVQRQFVWLDRSGKETEKVAGPDTAESLMPSLSPDGRRVALTRVVNGNADVWLLDVGRGVLSRFTFDAAYDNYPIWSPDGSRIVFGSNRKGVYDFFQKLVSGAASEELLPLASQQPKFPMDWSPDGRFILYRSLDPTTGFDLWALPLEADRQPFPVVHTNFDERNGQFSPDGKWVAYQSNESGRFEIYVQPFPGLGAKFQVSNNGGAEVRWRRDGKELFYIALDDRLMAAPIRFGAGGQTIESGVPVPLFATHVGGAVGQNVYRQQYMVSPDGQGFLMNTITDETTSPITVVLNWKAPAE